MSLSLELQKLPPQALDIIRYLATTEGADVDEIIQGTGLSERALGKAIRRLVTRYYVQMTGQGYYALTRNGKEAAEVILEYDGGIPTAPVSDYAEEEDSVPQVASSYTSDPFPAVIPTPPPPPIPAAAPTPPASVAAAQAGPRHPRRLSVLIAQEMVVKSTSLVLAGLDAPISGEPGMNKPAELIIRLNAPGCDVEPVERPLSVSPDKPAGPVQFRVKPRREGTIRIKVEAYQFVTHRDIVPLGGMYFDRHVAPLPTVLSAEFKALGAMIQLFPGDKK